MSLSKTYTMQLIDGKELMKRLHVMYPSRPRFDIDYPLMTGESKYCMWERNIDGCEQWVDGDYKDGSTQDRVDELASEGRVPIRLFLDLLVIRGELEPGTYTVYHAW